MIEKIRNYFIENKLIDEKMCLNVDFLGNKPTEFSLSKVNVDPVIETYINGSSYMQFEFQLLSRNNYSAEVLNNIKNNNFFEEFSKKIKSLNKQKILPNIEGISSIECLDNGALASTTPNTAQYSILMRITYYEN